MRRTLNQIFATSRYQSLIEKDRARMGYAIGVLMLIMMAVYLVAPRAQQSLLEQIPTNPQLLLQFSIFFVFTLGGVVLTRFGRNLLGNASLLTAFILSLGLLAVQNGVYDIVSSFTLVLIILLAGLLLGVRGLAAGTGIAVLIAAAGLAARATVPPPTTYNTTSALVNLGAGIGLVSGFTYLFLRYARLSQREGTARLQEERLRLAEITSQVSQRISHRMALNDVLTNAVNQIETSYPQIYHAQIFLVDEQREKARLVASTGDVGRKLLERKHSLPVGSMSVIGQVTGKGKPVITRAGATTGVHRRNEFLPDTAVECGFPLRIGDEIIGALDLQSKQTEAFSGSDIPVFQSLADNIAVAIDSARLFEDAERRLSENQVLVEQMRRSAEEVERLNQQLTSRFWQEYLDAQDDALGLSVDFQRKVVRPESEWTPTLQEAIQNNHLIQQKQSGGQVIAVPLRVRGQVIGAMEFELDEAGNLSPEDLNLMEEVGEQLGLAAETNRLFGASQRIAQREALVNEVATRLQASNNVELTLNEAARSLRSMFKASKVAIRLGKPPAPLSNGQDKEAQP